MANAERQQRAMWSQPSGIGVGPCGRRPALARRWAGVAMWLGSGLVCLLGLGACANLSGGLMSLPVPQQLFHDGLFQPPAEPVDAARVMALSPQMRQFIAQDLPRSTWRDSPQRALVDALYTPGRLRLEYDAGMTRNAAEAFAARSGNCLSLVLMTAAMAQALNLDVSFNSALTEETWSRRGNLLVRSGHVNLNLGPRVLNIGSRHDPSQLTIDFLPASELQGLRTRPIRLATVLAMYFNNRAVETLVQDPLVQGQFDQAYAFAREALRQDATFAPAYNTLGLVYRRHGDMALAASAFEYALTLDNGQRQAMANLIDTLVDLGRPHEARQWRATLARLEPYPPFYFLDQGRAAAERGDWPTARSLFERELARADYSAETHFWLAQASLRLGDVAAAKRHLRLAGEHSVSTSERALYAAKLDKLKALNQH